MTLDFLKVPTTPIPARLRKIKIKAKYVSQELDGHFGMIFLRSRSLNTYLPPNYEKNF